MGLIAFLAGQGRTLREIAAEVGVSHETVRKALGDRGADAAEAASTAPSEPIRSLSKGAAAA